MRFYYFATRKLSQTSARLLPPYEDLPVTQDITDDAAGTSLLVPSRTRLYVHIIPEKSQEGGGAEPPRAAKADHQRLSS